MNECLEDADAVMTMVNEPSGRDGLMTKYDGNWWAKFSLAASAKQDPSEILIFWNEQKNRLPIPVLLPPSDLLCLNTLSWGELQAAFVAVTENVAAIDDQIAQSLLYATKTAQTVNQTKSILRDLTSLLADLEKKQHEESLKNAGVTGDQK